MLGVKIIDNGQKIAILQVIGPISYTSLEYGKFDFQNVKVDYKLSILDEIRNIQKTKDLVGNK